MKKLLIMATTSFSLLAMDNNNNNNRNTQAPKIEYQAAQVATYRFYLDIQNDTNQEEYIYCHKYNQDQLLHSESYSIEKDWIAKFVIYEGITHFIFSKKQDNPSIMPYLAEKFESSSDCAVMSKPIKHNNNAIFATYFKNKNPNELPIPTRKMSDLFDK